MAKALPSGHYPVEAKRLKYSQGKITGISDEVLLLCPASLRTLRVEHRVYSESPRALVMPCGAVTYVCHRLFIVHLQL